MPRVPGTFSGNGGVPPNMKWDPLDPPVRNTCSGMVEIHTDACDNDCETIPLVESEVELINENREWARLGMDTNNVTPGSNLFTMSNQIRAMINVVASLLDEDGMEQLNEEFRQVTLAALRDIRMQSQDAIKRARLGLPQKTILGPDGQPL